MALTDKMKNVGSHIQQGATNASHKLLHIILRLLTGFFIGYVVALIFQELIGFGTFMLVFATLLVMSLIFKALSQRSILQIVIIDVFFVLIGMILQMYIMIASQ